MEQEIEGFICEVIRSERKTVGLEVRRDGKIIVRVPKKFSDLRVKKFIKSKKEWIQKNLQKAELINGMRTEIPRIPEEERQAAKAKAKEIFNQKASYYAQKLGVRYNKIYIKEQKTRWGSCSSNQNLNFNWKLLYAPLEVLDYVVVHEVSHLKEMNHSKAFWRVVEQLCPDYQKHVQWLKENGWKLIQM